MLVTGYCVVEAGSGHNADGLEIRHDTICAFSRVAGFQKYRGPIRTFHEHGATPVNVDVVNLELLC
jgi:hypothetical protein